MSDVRLTSLSHGAGCACKLSPHDLERVLSLVGMAPEADGDRLLVGYNTGDDAAVYAVSDDLAVVFTADFFTPIVDDPFDWGRIAATNALSDVYAMGGQPFLALNLVAWPREGLPLELLAEVLRGGREAAGGGGTVVAGGHSIDDPEPKYGMAVVGRVTPGELIRNDAGRPGDVLVLTKPLGLGVVSTAVKRDAAPPAVVERAVSLMTTLNAVPAQVGRRHGVRAGTDVTGFGLLGHLRGLVAASGCAAEVDHGAVPVIEGVPELLAAGMVAGGTKRNRDFVSPSVDWDGLADEQQLLLADAQTSGGLLLAVPEAKVDAVVADLAAGGAPCAAVVGRLVEGEPGTIRVMG